MKEVLKDLVTGLAVLVGGLSLFLFVLWLFFITPAWATGSLCFLAISYCLGTLVRLNRASR